VFWGAAAPARAAALAYYRGLRGPRRWPQGPRGGQSPAYPRAGRTTCGPGPRRAGSRATRSGRLAGSSPSPGLPPRSP